MLAVMAVLGLSQSVTPLLTLLPHQLAKSSVLWNSTILLILNPTVSLSTLSCLNIFYTQIRGEARRFLSMVLNTVQDMEEPAENSEAKQRESVV